MGKDFMTKTQKAMSRKNKIDTWDLINFRASAQQKKLSLELTGNQQNGKIFFSIYPSDKGLIFRIYKELIQINKKKKSKSG